jgi:hypothetical protein
MDVRRKRRADMEVAEWVLKKEPEASDVLGG